MSSQTNGLLLTWKPHGHARGGRWCKKIDGNRIYFGTAQTKSDRAAYREATERFRQHMVEREERQLYQRKLKRKQREFTKTGRAPQYAAWAMSIKEAHEQAEDKRQRDVIDEARRLNGGGIADNKRPTLPKLIDDYLAEADRRHLVTLKHPETLPPKRRLSVSAVKSIHDQLKPFKRWAESNRASLGVNIAATEKMLKKYRAYLDDQMLASKLAPATVTNRVRGLKRFIDWLWQNRYLEEVPRGLDEICRKYTQESTAKALTVKQIGRLWRRADPRMRAIMALCLNCGFYPREAALLVGGDIKNGYVARRRPKTGVPSKHKLWPITAKLIEQTRMNRGSKQLLWQTRHGNPLIHETGTNRCDSLHKQGIVQPAVKCRGREYLRIIYGPEYTQSEHLNRLRSRGLGRKRGLALREFALGIEALDRFVRREPLRRVHECVFGVMALESEPVDPRL